jgi:hypothetical protein
MNRTLPSAIALLVFTIFGCSDESVQPEPEPPAAVAWQRLDIPGIADEYLVGLNANDQDLFALAPRFFATLDGTGEFDVWASLLDFATTRALTFVNDEYFLYPVDTDKSPFHKSMSINWRYSAGAGQVPSEVQLPLVVLDPTLSKDARYAAGDMHSRLAVINREGYMLVPVFDWTVNVAHNTYLYLLRLSPRAPGDYSEISVDLEKRIDWPHEPMWIMTDGERFFASTVLETYEVGVDGSITSLCPELTYSVLTHEGKLYANRVDGVHVSGDGGVTWELVVYVGKGDLLEIDGRLCLLSGAYAYRIDTDENTAVQLWHNGLPTNNGGPIEAMSVFHGQVYAATHEGLYHIALDDFFTPRP